MAEDEGAITQKQTRQTNQAAKLRDANAKYKNLLKLARSRIEEQEGQLEERRSDTKRLTHDLNEAHSRIDSLVSRAAAATGPAGSADDESSSETTVVRVCQLIKDEISDYDTGGGNGSVGEHEIGDAIDESPDDLRYEIWALMEYETTPFASADDMVTGSDAPASRRFKRWHRFATESALSDRVRRDAGTKHVGGEPLALPPYSLSPERSRRVMEEARRAVASVSEEFRRFRVRAEVAKKQADATVRALHSSSVQTTRMRIEGQDLESELAQAKTDHAQLSSLRSELAEQEARWKESYDLLLAENEKLKSSGAEALLAAQWRHRYEACRKEREDAVTNLDMERERVAELQETKKRADAGKYENKYRDLKESFRLYRKKAKEIFEQTQAGQTFLPTLHDQGAEVAKVAYLKNLMVNYLASDTAVREHMEPAIGTVLKFTEEDRGKIEKAKEANSSWFGAYGSETS